MSGLDDIRVKPCVCGQNEPECSDGERNYCLDCTPECTCAYDHGECWYYYYTEELVREPVSSDLGPEEKPAK